MTWVAAVWPGMWIYNGAVLSESVTVTLVAATLLAFYRFRERTSGLRAAVVGLMVALCALTRPELLILLVVFAPLWLPATSWARRLSLTVVFIASAAVLVGPWVGRNLHDYTHTEIMSSNFGSVIVGANCGPRIRDRCSVPGMRRAPRPFGRLLVMPQLSTATTATWGSTTPGRTFIGSRQSWRRGLGRALGVWPTPTQAVTWNATAAGVWPRWSSWLYLVTWWISIPLVIIGAVSLRRRSMIGWPLYALILLYFVVSAVLYADPRFASSCQPALAVLVGVGLASIIRAGLGRQGAHVRPAPLVA